MKAGQLPPFFFNGRITGLEFTIIWSLIWIIFGFDSTIEGTFSPDNPIGLGFHWSTLQTIFLFFYLAMVNFNMGGLESFAQLKMEVRRDLKYVFRFKPYRKMGKTDEDVDVYLNSPYGFGAFRGLIVGATVPFIGLMTFEVIWVFLYNYFQFGDLWWPIYRLNGGSLLFRNLIFLLGPLYLYFLSVKLTSHFIRKVVDFHGLAPFSLPRSFRIEPRLRGIIILLWLCISTWTLWIYMPSSQTIKYISPGPDGELVLSSELGGKWIFPAQNLFPQTTYTIYNVSRGESYSEKNLGGWWQDDPSIHALNLVVKYLTIGTVSYVLMARIKPRN